MGTRPDYPDNTPPREQRFKPAYSVEFLDSVSWFYEVIGQDGSGDDVNRLKKLLEDTGDLTPWGEHPKSETFTRYLDKYDESFIRYTAYWSDRMCLCFTPQQITVVADFLKHVAIVESNLGYNSGFKPEGGSWIDTEDVMQVGNPDDPAMGVLGGGSDERWRDGKGNAHSFAFNTTALVSGRTAPLQPEEGLQITNYNISGEESIFWGSMWFFHKLTASGWRCEQALTQEVLLEAALGYNGARVYKKLVRSAVDRGHSPHALSTLGNKKSAPSPETPSTHWDGLPASE